MTRKITATLFALCLLLGGAPSRADNFITVGTLADGTGSCTLRDAIASSAGHSSVGGSAPGTRTDHIPPASGPLLPNHKYPNRPRGPLPGPSHTNNTNT